MKKKELKFTKEEAVEKLGYDTIRESIFDLFDVVSVKYNPENSKVMYVATDEADLTGKEYWDPMLNDIAKWITDYKNLNKRDRIIISDVAVVEAKKGVTMGVFQVINGQNGQTQISRQSLKHIMDIVTYLEDYYGARAWLSSVGSHSDVYYYTISFVIWKEHLKEAENHTWGNLRPLYHG